MNYRGAAFGALALSLFAAPVFAAAWQPLCNPDDPQCPGTTHSPIASAGTRIFSLQQRMGTGAPVQGRFSLAVLDTATNTYALRVGIVDDQQLSCTSTWPALGC